MMSSSTSKSSKSSSKSSSRFSRQLIHAEDLRNLDPQRHQVWLLHVPRENMEMPWTMGKRVLDPKENISSLDEMEACSLAKAFKPSLSLRKENESMEEKYVNVLCPDKNGDLRSLNIKYEGDVHFEAQVDESAVGNQQQAIELHQGQTEKLNNIEDKERHPLLLPQEVSAKMARYSERQRSSDMESQKRHKKKKKKNKQ